MIKIRLAYLQQYVFMWAVRGNDFNFLKPGPDLTRCMWQIVVDRHKGVLTMYGNWLYIGWVAHDITSTVQEIIDHCERVPALRGRFEILLPPEETENNFVFCVPVISPHEEKHLKRLISPLPGIGAKLTLRWPYLIVPYSALGRTIGISSITETPREIEAAVCRALGLEPGQRCKTE